MTKLESFKFHKGMPPTDRLALKLVDSLIKLIYWL